MRLVHIVNRLDPSDGGPPAVAARIAAAQALAGHEVAIAAHAPVCAHADIDAAYGGIDGFENVTQVFLNGGTVLERLRAAAATESLRALLHNADFVHVHGMWRPLLLRVARYCDAHALPYCLTPHGMLTQWAMSQKRAKKRLGLALGWKRALDRAAFLQFLHGEERSDAGQLGLTAAAVLVPNGVSAAELALIGPADPEFRMLLPSRYVLFLARLHPSKGPDLLCAAFDRLADKHPDIHVVFAGPDFGSAANLEHHKSRSRYGARIHLLGGVYGLNKLHLLRHALCLAHPTRQEGFSVSILEALGVGLPVVTTPNAHFPALAEAGAGMIAHPSAPALAQALDQVLSDPQLRKSMGAAGRRLINDGYEWARIASRLTEAYERFLPRQTARAAS